MSGLGGAALRKVMETVHSTFYPAQYRGPDPVVSSKRPVTRARVAAPPEIKPPGPRRSIMPAYYEMSQNFKQTRHRFRALMILALLLLVAFILSIGLRFYFGR